MRRAFFVFFVFFQLQIVHGGWTDICNFMPSTVNNPMPTLATCYLWNQNPFPFNDLAHILSSPVCTNGCTIKINPYSGNCSDIVSCSSVLTCQNGQNGQNGQPLATFPLPQTITLSIDNVFISSLCVTSPTNPSVNSQNVQIANTVDTAFLITSQNVQLKGLDFTGPNIEKNDPLLSNMATIVWTGSGRASVASVRSNSPYTVVLFVGAKGFFDLVLDGVAFLPPAGPGNGPPSSNKLPVIILQANNISLQCTANQANSSVFLLAIVSRSQDPNPASQCTLYYNMSQYIQKAPSASPNSPATLNFPTCSPAQEIDLASGCPNPAIFATLVTLLSVFALALVVPVLFMLLEKGQRQLHSSSIATTKSAIER